MAAAVAFPAHYLGTALHCSRTGRRWCVYAGNHPSTGGDCRTSMPWRDHGGPSVCPWTSGLISRLVERTHREHGRREVLRTWGAGMRALLAEQKALHP